jgi:hypothetical protein
MVQISPFKNNASKILLTSSLLRFLIGVVIVLNAICILWMARGRAAAHVGVPGLPGDAVSPSHVGQAPPRNKDGAPVIPFVVSLTACGEDPFMEGAAVLKYSIHLASIHGNLGGRYDYKMYAVYHPDAAECAKDLVSLGFELIERAVPVKVEEIEGEYLRSRIEKNGCCGAKELIKLEALTFTQYPIVVHLDMDFILLSPLDALFDAMLDETGDLSKYKQSLNVMWPNQTLPKKINAFFTRDCKSSCGVECSIQVTRGVYLGFADDYALFSFLRWCCEVNTVGYTRKIKPVQGGFLVLRPDLQVYREIVNIVKKGDFDKEGGWGGVTRLFYGSMTIQGKHQFGLWFQIYLCRVVAGMTYR